MMEPAGWLPARSSLSGLQSHPRETPRILLVGTLASSAWLEATDAASGT
jgi:hypothetical protein